MPLTKAFDYINSAADKAFLASCTFKGDACSCTYDDHHFHALHSKGIPMPSILDTLSAAERKALANKILDLPYEQQRTKLFKSLVPSLKR
jgi:hypothetical protein